MSHNDLGAFSNNNLAGGWTPQAVECWSIDCVCARCTIQKMMPSTKCQMKATVIELVKKYGNPNKENTKRFKEVLSYGVYTCREENNCSD